MAASKQERAQYALEVSSAFVLDQVSVGRYLFDFVDALIIVAVTQANVDAIQQTPALQRTYATYDAPAPEELRRPISINALAHSIRLPFETVRRRVLRLSRMGVLRSRESGVMTSMAQVRSPIHRRVAEAGYGRICALYLRLSGVPELAEIVRGHPWTGPPPLRAAARISSDYLLRTVDVLTTQLGGPLDAAIWLEILRSNVDPERAPRAEQGGRAPVRVSAVAKRLALPAETVRRRAACLVSMAACEQTGDGLLISTGTLSRPEFGRIAAANLRDLRRMYSQPADLGALPSLHETLPAAA